LLGADLELFRPRPKTPYSRSCTSGMRRYKRTRDALLAFALVRREIPEARLYVMWKGILARFAPDTNSAQVGGVPK